MLADLLLQPVLAQVPLLALVVLAAPLTALLSRHPLRLVGFGGAMVFSLDSAVLALVLWTVLWTAPAGSLAGGGAAVAGLVTLVPWLLGYLVAELLARERRLAVRAYNVLLSALAGVLFVAVALAVRGVVAESMGSNPFTRVVGVWDVVAVLASSAAYVGTDLLLSALWVSRVEGSRLRETLADAAGLVAGGSVLAVNATAVLAAMLLTSSSPWSLLLLAPVAVALLFASRTSTLALTERGRAHAMYAAADAVQRAGTAAEVTEAVRAAAEEATAAPAVVQGRPPGAGQVGATFAGRDGERWLVVGPRANRHAFVPADETVVATLAALCEQSLARLAIADDVRWLATHDTLTHLLNRGAWLAVAAERAGPASAVLFCDVDRFKAVNDTYGHQAGDQVLVGLARALTDVVGDEGVVGRLGGDELVVLLPETTPDRLEACASAVAEAARGPLAAYGEDLGLGLSIGVATVPELGAEVDGGVSRSREALAEALLDRADGRMYGQKRGRSVLRPSG
ncbi:GGDEF domain-containing protein [Aquipuribacter sp. SD81]|uniref:GGDEF domain-containing protein n=1 Tax=Aquipuribacter sp. SD81 TaxID=3127703 RepID=UPI0030174A0D